MARKNTNNSLRKYFDALLITNSTSILRKLNFTRKKSILMSKSFRPVKETRGHYSGIFIDPQDFITLLHDLAARADTAVAR